MSSQEFPGQDWDVEIRDFEFDERNLAHLAPRGIDDNLVWDVWGDAPRCLVNPPRADRSGSHLMIGADANGRVWTIVVLLIDDALALWRPITGWPSTEKEKRAWHVGN